MYTEFWVMYYRRSSCLDNFPRFDCHCYSNPLHRVAVQEQTDGDSS